MALALLEQFSRYGQTEYRNMRPGLHRIYEACERMGHPERKFPSIHVAGTNGKGSVVATLHAILQEAGFEVGRFTSPHLIRINERFRIGSKDISDQELEEILAELARKEIFRFPRDPEDSNQLTFFELCTLIAFLYFAKNRVDLAVIEVGLGGRLDSTNILFPILSIITEIGLDHCEILGNSLTAIATEKGGILKDRTPWVLGATAQEAQSVLKQIGRHREAPCYEVMPPQILFDGFFNWGKWKKLKSALLGEHQIWNAAIALTALKVLQEKGYALSESAVREGLTHVDWPGRLEILQSSPLVLLDGAHNVQGIQALVQSLKGFKEVESWKILFGAAREKEIIAMLEALKPIADSITLCKMENARSFQPEELREQWEGFAHLEIARDGFEAFQRLSSSLREREGLLVTGSLYLVGEIKKKFTKRISSRL